jgi:DNA processing protein
MQYPIRVWRPDDEEYPYRLRECYDKPAQLFVKGNIPSMSGHVVAIVGTRRPTERGKELTHNLVRDLADQLDSVTIVSGGAYGIDIAAHRAAIQYGLPTIMVLAHGLDKMYPYQHINEANAAMENGGLISEYPEGTEPFAANFLQRNRIIAGLADAVVIVESKLKGGSLCTARFAFDYNRELFAFPGRPTDETSLGCNLLIRSQKAQLINDASELIHAMAWTTKTEAKQPVQTQLVGLLDDLSASQQELLAKLQEAEDGLHINLLVMETERPYSDVAADLTMLELQGLVRSLPGGIYRFRQ